MREVSGVRSGRGTVVHTMLLESRFGVYRSQHLLQLALTCCGTHPEVLNSCWRKLLARVESFQLEANWDQAFSGVPRLSLGGQAAGQLHIL